MNLTKQQINAIQQLLDTGVEYAAGVLNDMLEAPVRLHVPQVQIGSLPQLQRELEERLGIQQVAAVCQSFSGPFSGVVELVFPTDSASTLAAILTGEEPGTPDLDAVRIGTLSEVGNILINSVLSVIVRVLRQRLDYALPIYIEDTVENLLVSANAGSGTPMLLAEAQFTMEQLQIRGDIILISQAGSFDWLLSALALEAEV